MGVYVIEFARSRPCVGKRLFNGLNRPVAVRWRIRDAIAAARVSVASQFRVNFCAALFRRAPVFEYEKRSTFTEHKAVARGVERTAGFFRRVIVRRECAQQAEGGKPE